MDWSRGALESIESCPICHENNDTHDIYERRDDEGNMPDVWIMHRCKSCYSIYLSPRPDTESLPAAYRDYLTHADKDIYEEVNNGEGVLWDAVRGYIKTSCGINFQKYSSLGASIITTIPPVRQKLDRFARHLTKNRFPETGILLDIGCGNGAFMALAKKMGWKVEGVEPDPVSVNLCRSKGLYVFSGSIDSVNSRQGHYDVITMNHVIEHVPDPGDFLQKSFDLLRPGGMLWVALPNPQSFGKKLFGTAFCALHPPFHFCLASQKALCDKMHQAGFERIEVKRRGFHAKAHWRDSTKIAEKYSLPMPHRSVRLLVRWLSDVFSAFTPRWSEETVIVAYRPHDHLRED